MENIQEMMNIEQLTTPIVRIIGTAIIGALSLILIMINKHITKWFLDKIWLKISREYGHSKLKKDEIEKDSKIREILIELRTIVKSDRACLFQFHNGRSFSTKNPIWKVSNTHESVAPGVSSEIGELQDIKASALIETLQSFWDDKNPPNGVEKISPEYCKECPSTCKSSGKKVIFIDVVKLEDSYSRSLLTEQGISYVIDIPIHNGDNNCVGFVAVNYRSKDVNVEKIKNYAYDICRNATQIEFLLLNKGLRNE